MDLDLDQYVTIGLIYAVKKQRNIYIWVIRDQETEYWVDQRNT